MPTVFRSFYYTVYSSQNATVQSILNVDMEITPLTEGDHSVSVPSLIDRYKDLDRRALIRAYLADMDGIGYGVHVIRVSMLAIQIAKTLSLPDEQVQNIGVAGLFHDAGKLVYPKIFNRSNPHLSTREIIHNHPVDGALVVSKSSWNKPDIIAAIVGHHENYDGSGYPDGLKGDAISLYARIIHIADVLDAKLDRSRVWDNGNEDNHSFTVNEALEEMLSESGSAFDPGILDNLKNKPIRLPWEHEDLVESYCDVMDLRREEILEKLKQEHHEPWHGKALDKFRRQRALQDDE